MAWSVTFNDLATLDSPALSYLTEEQIEYVSSQHPEYLGDLDAAFKMARERGFASATLTGFRAPNPYGGDEVVDISVRGMLKAPDFIKEMKHIVAKGPDAET